VVEVVGIVLWMFADLILKVGIELLVLLFGSKIKVFRLVCYM
jgi:hypothetical protein